MTVLRSGRDGLHAATARVHADAAEHGTTRASLSADAGRLPQGSRAALVDQVVDLARLHHADHIAVSVPLGDTESLRQLDDRTEHMTTRAAGSTALVDADLVVTTNEQAAFAPATIRSVIDRARRAPSLHNTQPWQWRLTGDRLELRADRSRQLRVADPDGHSLLVSCGAALVLTDLALRGRGWTTSIERLPDPHDPDLLATFTDPQRYRPTDAERALLVAADRRSSARGPFLPRPVPEELIEVMRHAAGGGAVHAHFPVRADESLNLAVAVSWADRVERNDAGYLAELALWLRDPEVHPRDDATDGVPASAIPHVTAGHPRHTDIPVRDFEIGVSGREQIEADLDERPLMAILLTESDSVGEHLAVGESMMRLMLEANRAGLACCPLSQAVDLLAFRTRVQTLMGWTSYPQMMLRIGYASSDQPARPRSPRRPVDDQLEMVQTGR